MQPDGPVPLYYQLELMLRELIESGQWKPGGELPSEHEMAQQFNVSRITVRRTLDRLEEDGLIVRRRGARTTLAANITYQAKNQQPAGDFRGFEDELRRQGLSPQAIVLETTVGAPPPSIATSLELPPGEEVVRIRRLGNSDGNPLWVESRYFPLPIGRSLIDADLSRDSILTLFRELGLHVGDVEAHVQAVVATPRQAQLLNLPAGAPLLLHESITFVEGRRPAQILRAYLRGDRYELVLHARPRADHSGLALVDGGYLVSGGQNRTQHS